MTRIVSSKDKETVRRFALKDARQILWRDEHGIWHAALTPKDVPKYATKQERV